MPPARTATHKGESLHFSVGAIIKENDTYLLIDRASKPFGFAGVAGHVDEGETEIEALARELKEESGLSLESYRLLYEEIVESNECVKGATNHHWFVYYCVTSGEIHRDRRETKSIGWYTEEEIKKLTLEPVWQRWFTKYRIL